MIDKKSLGENLSFSNADTNLVNNRRLGILYWPLLLICLWPTLYNGYPLFFHDSIEYLWFASDPAAAKFGHTGWTAYYPLFLYPSLFFRSNWLTVLLQAIATLFVLREFYRAFIPAMTRVWSAILIGISLLLTQQTWLVSWIMPDVFAGLAFLALMILVIGPVSRRYVHTGALVTIAVFGMLMSAGNLLASSGAILFAYFLQQLFRFKITMAIGKMFAIITAAVVLAVAPNMILYGQATLNVGSQAMVFSRLVEIGLAQDYLHMNCSPAKYSICTELPALDRLRGVGSGFLWGDGGEERLASKLDAWHDVTGEFAKLNRDIILNNVPDMLDSMFQATLKVVSLSSHDPGVQLSESMIKYIHILFPNESTSFDQSRQQLAQINFAQFGWIYFLSMYTSYFLSAAIFVVAILRRDHLVAVIIACAVIYLLSSAFIHAGLVGPYARYHVKAVWVLWPVLLAASGHIFYSTARGRAAGN